eukprot:Rmarinus@m.11789
MQIPQVPLDSISNLTFSPNDKLLVSSSWDNVVRCWSVNYDNPAASVLVGDMPDPHTQPALCCCWNSDGRCVYSAGAGMSVREWNVESNSCTDVVVHDAPVKCVAWSSLHQCLVSGSWDKTLRIWECSSGNTVTLKTTDRIYDLCLLGDVLSIATADKFITIYDLRRLDRYVQQFDSQCMMQSRSLAICRKPMSIVVGSIDGRVGVHCLQHPENNFTFRAHVSTTNQSFAVNSVRMHPKRPEILLTAGSDGDCKLWDIEDRKLKKVVTVAETEKAVPLSAAVFNTSGDVIACASGYDWSKGIEHYQSHSDSTSICLLRSTEIGI